MAITYFPFQDVASDRLYTDVQFANFYAKLFKNGVMATVDSGLVIKPSSPASMIVNVGSGAALTNGRQLTNSADYPLTVTAASASVDRVDSIVVQLNLPMRQVSLLYKEGTIAIQRDANIYELQLAKITVPKNASTITAANITDMRADETVCGYSSPLGELTVSSLQDQYEAMLQEAFTAIQTEMNTDAGTLQTLLTNQEVLFDAWFADLQDTLATNVEANLQLQIDALDASTLLATITHNLNEYPHVRALAWDYGIGLTGLGNEPAGLFGGGNVITVPCTAEYLNKQGLKVSIPIGYAMVTPTATKVNDREWLFTSGTKSLQITLMEAR